MRYTFPQTYQDLQAVRAIIFARQAWRRPAIIVLVLILLLAVVLPLLVDRRPPLRTVVVNNLPYVFIIALWIAFIAGLARPRLIFGALIALGLIAIAAVVVTDPSATAGGIFMYLLPFTFVFVLMALVPYVWARQYRANPLLQGDMTVELTPEELRIVRETNTMTHRWNAMVRAADTPEFFLFYVTKASAHYLPKRVIPPEDLANLRTFLRAHVPSGLL